MNVYPTIEEALADIEASEGKCLSVAVGGFSWAVNEGGGGLAPAEVTTLYTNDPEVIAAMLQAEREENQRLRRENERLNAELEQAWAEVEVWKERTPGGWGSYHD